jgi:hypothetical protein
MTLLSCSPNNVYTISLIFMPGNYRFMSRNYLFAKIGQSDLETVF